MKLRPRFRVVLIGALLLIPTGCGDSTNESGPTMNPLPSTSTIGSIAPETTTTTTTTIAPTTSYLQSTSSTAGVLHQWGQIDDLVACHDYLEAVIANDGAGDLRLVSVIIFFPDGSMWQDRIASWDELDRLLPAIPPDESAVWRVTPSDVGREGAFVPGDYRVMVGTEVDPNADDTTVSLGVPERIEGNFVDGALPSSGCG